MFNKRHYEAIATVMQRQYPGESNIQERLLWGAICGDLAFEFACDNVRFDKGRFLHACKPGSNVRAKTAHLKVA